MNTLIVSTFDCSFEDLQITKQSANQTSAKNIWSRDTNFSMNKVIKKYHIYFVTFLLFIIKVKIKFS